MKFAVRALLVDDNVLFLEGLGNMLSAAGIEVIGLAASSREALAKAELLKPDVILMDIQMPGGDGIEATRRIKAKLPAVKVVMLTVSQDDVNLFEAIKAGAAGYLLKGFSKENFLVQLSGLATGEAPLAPGLATKILAEFARREHEREGTTEEARAQLLTPRHVEILRRLVSGLTYKEIGESLGIGESAVKYHMNEITARLQLDNKFQVVAFAEKMGLLPEPGK